jgi:hypothetical protein
VKAVCLALLVLNITTLIAAHLPSEAWAFRVCGTAFGFCDYPWVLAFGAALWVGMIIMLKEIN